MADGEAKTWPPAPAGLMWAPEWICRLIEEHNMAHAAVRCNAYGNKNKKVGTSGSGPKVRRMPVVGLGGKGKPAKGSKRQHAKDSGPDLD